MKYSGTDFKFTSQANHMAKLKVMIDAYKTGLPKSADQLT
jgi:hypothetical protein